jgi:hypothetical protein
MVSVIPFNRESKFFFYLVHNLMDHFFCWYLFLECFDQFFKFRLNIANRSPPLRAFDIGQNCSLCSGQMLNNGAKQHWILIIKLIGIARIIEM